jgi:hypothetical protein
VLIGIIAVCSLAVSRRNSKFETGEQAILSLGKRLILSCGVQRRRFVDRRHGPTISAFPLSAQREISLRLAVIDYLACLSGLRLPSTHYAAPSDIQSPCTQLVVLSIRHLPFWQRNWVPEPPWSLPSWWVHCAKVASAARPSVQPHFVAKMGICSSCLGLNRYRDTSDDVSPGLHAGIAPLANSVGLIRKRIRDSCSMMSTQINTAVLETKLLE